VVLGLAPVLVQEVREAIEAIRESGTTILLVEQNAGMALKLADRAYGMEGGCNLPQGTCEELLGNAEVRETYLGA
jgi:branched-chain amino acid transport system ATP-binding protein